MNSKIWKIGLVLLGAAMAYYFYHYRQPRFIAGEQAPDFTAELANGQTARLSDLRGKYVLLQFWGSWCGPCRAENRHLTPLYRKYNKQGFEIFSIGIESRRESWQRAIASDQLVWPYHTVELNQFNGPLAQLFNIHSIPTTFLINPDGMIMGVNLSTQQIAQRLDSGLASR